MADPVRFLFDYLSPYAYLAWKRIHALAERHDREVEPIPVLLAALLTANGQKGPAEIPAKRRWVIRDVARTARAIGVPLSPPPSHPFNPLLALRVSALPMRRGERRRLIDALWDATWGGGAGVEDPRVVAGIASSVGQDGEALVRAAGEPEGKHRVRRHTEEAIAAGAFGVPTVIVGAELFWGYDALGHVERLLAGDDLLDPELVARWEALPASATRGA
jgi:2-hydroxychromene-2-carboxylate isomerase